MWVRVGIAVLAVTGALLMACGEYGDPDAGRRAAVRQREATLVQAEALFPAPVLANFPLRQALVKFTEREDLLNHPFYVYILGDQGNVIGYYVAQTTPVNSCTFLSSTERIYGGASPVVLTAPSLDGIFYGGGGSAAGCDEWFFFDVATDALIKIRGVRFFAADQPLLLEAAPIAVEVR